MKEGTLKLGDKTIEYKIYKRSKKNIIFKINNKGILIVSIPKHRTYKVVVDILKEKFYEIYDKTSGIKKKYEEKKFNGWVDILGVPIEVFVEEDELKDYLLVIAKKEILKIVEEYSKIIKLYPLEVRIRELKTAWGICYSNKKITYNYKLIHLERELIEYVVVHELCHLKHMNHSKEFWKEVEKYKVNYKVLKKKLKLYKNNN